MKKVRWGVLGTAKIGREKVIPAMRQGTYCDVTAIGSRRLDGSKEVAEFLGIDKAYGSYEDLLADSDVDAVYIPLPNHLHVPWTLKSLEAGKHVLCEKPIGLSEAEALSLAEGAAEYPHLKVMEAFMYRHHPQWEQSKTWVDRGRIGELRTVHSFFSYYNVDAENVRNRAEIGGGGLMDIGCYCVSLARHLFSAEPRRVSATMEIDPAFSIDRLTSGIIEFDAGTSTFTCATQLAPHQRVYIFGTDGKIEIEIPFNAPPDVPTRVWLTVRDESEEVTFDVCNQYTLQADLLSKAILDDAPVPVPIEDAVANMAVIDGIRQSAEQGSWVELGPQ